MSVIEAITVSIPTQTRVEFLVISNESPNDYWDFDNFVDAVAVLSTCIGHERVNEAMLTNTLTEWQPDVSGFSTKWRIIVRNK